MDQFMCKKCKTIGSHMGDDESLFECDLDRSHIWSYHLDCKTKPTKEAKFIGFIVLDLYEDDISDDSCASLMNHTKFRRTYTQDMWADGAIFVWFCNDCKKYYQNTMCG